MLFPRNWNSLGFTGYESSALPQLINLTIWFRLILPVRKQKSRVGAIYFFLFVLSFDRPFVSHLARDLYTSSGRTGAGWNTANCRCREWRRVWKVGRHKLTIKPGASQHFWMRHQLLEMGDNGRLGYCRRTLGLHPLYLVPVGTGKGDK